MRIFICLFLLLALPIMAAPPILRNDLTTNNPAGASNFVANVAVAKVSAGIAADATHQQTNAVLTTFVAQLKYTGIITITNTTSTNVFYITNGIIANVTHSP